MNRGVELPLPILGTQVTGDRIDGGLLYTFKGVAPPPSEAYKSPRVRGARIGLSYTLGKGGGMWDH